MNKMCCVEIHTSGSSDTIWTNVTVTRGDDSIYIIEIMSENIKLYIPREFVKSFNAFSGVPNYIEVCTKNIEMYITEDKNKSDGRTIKHKTKKLLLDTFGNGDIKLPEYTETTNSWYFDVFVPEKEEQNNRVIPIPSIIALSKDGYNLDDSLGSHDLPQNIIDALNRAGIYRKKQEIAEKFLIENTLTYDEWIAKHKTNS